MCEKYVEEKRFGYFIENGIKCHERSPIALRSILTKQMYLLTAHKRLCGCELVYAGVKPCGVETLDGCYHSLTTAFLSNAVMN